MLPEPSEATCVAGLEICCSPYLGTDPATLEFIVGEEARALLEISLERLDALGARDASALRRLLGPLSEDTLPWGAAWDPRTCRLRQQLAASQSSEVDLGPVALLLASLGLLDPFELPWRGSSRPRWSRHLLPRCDQITLRKGPGGARLQLSSDKDLLGEWSAEALGGASVSGGVMTLPWIPVGADGCLLIRGASRADVYLERTFPETVLETSAVLDTLAEAGALISRHAAPFVPWIGRVIRFLVPADGSDGLFRSRSDAELPGVIEVSFPAPPLAVAEMLIHEASHQYFHALARLEDVDDGSDTALYYSPFRRIDRPIHMILLAFHAFGNVALFYREVLASGGDREGYCERNLARHLPDLRLLGACLERTSALTATGLLLWQPLAEILESM